MSSAAQARCSGISGSRSAIGALGAFLPAASRPGPPGLFLQLDQLLGNEQLAPKLALVAFQLFDAPIFAVLERFAARLLRGQTRLALLLQLHAPSGKLGAVQPLPTQSSAVKRPRSVQRSASATMRRFSSAEKRRRGLRSCSGFATTSVRASGETGPGMTSALRPRVVPTFQETCVSPRIGTGACMPHVMLPSAWLASGAKAPVV